MKIKRLVVFFLFVLTACSMKDQSQMSLALRSNPSTGYAWTFQNSDDNVLHLTKEAYQTSSDAIGATGEQQYFFEARKAGEVTLHFQYARAWEQAPPLYELTYVFEVNQLLEIVLVSVEGTYEITPLPQPIYE